MTKSRFFKNIRYIIFYGLIGTFINFTIMSSFNYALSERTDLMQDSKGNFIVNYLI